MAACVKGENPCENAVCVGEEQAGLRAGRTEWCEMDKGDGQGNVWGGAGGGQNRTVQRGGNEEEVEMNQGRGRAAKAVCTRNLAMESAGRRVEGKTKTG